MGFHYYDGLNFMLGRLTHPVRSNARSPPASPHGKPCTSYSTEKQCGVLLTEEHRYQKVKREGLSLLYSYLVSVPKYVKGQEKKDQDWGSNGDHTTEKVKVVEKNDPSQIPV